MAPSMMADDASLASFSVSTNKKAALSSPTRHVMRRRHSITFSGENTVHEIDKSTEENRDEIWYTKLEYDSIKARNKQIVRMKKTGNFEEDEENTFRGLEHKLKEGFNQRRSNKFNALNAVLAEQDVQYSRGLSNVEVVAEKYKEEASMAKESAYFLALQDADESWNRGVSPKIVVDIDEDGQSIVSDIDDLVSITSENTVQKKTRLRSLFHGISSMKNVKSHRRASM